MTTAAPGGLPAAAPPTGTSRWAGRSELLVALGLLVVAVVVLREAVGLRGAQTRGVVGPEAVPFVVGAMLVVCSVALAADVLRGGRGEAEGGEDVDLRHPSDWRTVLMLVAAFGTNIVLVDPLGWVISGSLLFWGCTVALGSRHWVRDPLIAVSLSLATFYGFAIGLGVNLPAGVLTGIL
ncbi:MAG: tripartite tricarboxylate transporter TctB family protein [Actinobacteria bacterium]|nr:tripartite tricarboxylate transporter TctB family protein [Actinomycetota bacterium]